MKTHSDSRKVSSKLGHYQASTDNFRVCILDVLRLLLIQTGPGGESRVAWRAELGSV